MSSITSYEEAFAAIWNRSGWDRGFISNPFAGDEAARLGLVRTRRLLDRLGSPDRVLTIVHVAGSKGKGSTCTFIDSIARASGARTGRFLSPHLHSIRERFVVDDVPVTEQEFASLVDEVMTAVADVERVDPAIGTLTAWELSTAIALLWFARRDCALAVIEVGMGGALDATNVIDPAVAVIARLDFEHTAVLGDTIAEIAANKAGIIKPGRPVASVDQPEEGMAVIRQRARDVGAPLLVASHDWTVNGTPDAFDVVGPDWRYTGLRSSLRGQFQMENAGLAIAAVHLLGGEGGMALSPDAVPAGLANAFIPGRFEVLRHPSGPTIVIDGAHSPESARALADSIRAEFPDQPVAVVVAMLADKDPVTVLPPLMDLASQVIVTSVKHARALPTARLVDSLDVPSGLVTLAPDVALAIDAARSSLTPGDGGVIVVTGSLVTAAEARVALGLT